MTLSQRLHDAAVLNQMKDELRTLLSVALVRCAGMATELQMLDADEVMFAIRQQFDPSMLLAPIQDCFSDAFYAATDACDVEPLTARRTMPSGATITTAE